MPRTLKISKSSNIKEAVVGDDGVLEVKFQSGQSARYRNFKPELMDEWEKDASPGSWFHRNVRSKPDDYPLIPSDNAPSTPPGVPDAATAIVGDGANRAAVLADVAESLEQKPLERATPAERANALLTAEGVTVTEDGSSEQVRVTAREAYEAYIRNSGGKNYEGKPCPKWEDLTAAIRGHWCAAVIAVSHNLQRDLLDQVNRLRKLVPWKNRGGGRS